MFGVTDPDTFIVGLRNDEVACTFLDAFEVFHR